MGCRYVALAVASKGTAREDLGTLAALVRHYRALKPDLVFHYTIKPNIYGSVAAWLARVPSIAVTTGRLRFHPEEPSGKRREAPVPVRVPLPA